MNKRCGSGIWPLARGAFGVQTHCTLISLITKDVYESETVCPRSCPVPAAARGARGCAKETPAEHAANVYAQQEVDSAPLHSNLPDYSLPPADLAKAQHLSTIHMTLHFVDEIWGIVSLLLLLGFGGIAWMRDRAVRLATAGDRAMSFCCLYLIAGIFWSCPSISTRSIWS